MHWSKPAVPAVLCLSLSSLLNAQEAHKQEPIVVTATRTAQTADAALAPVTVITREDIDNNPGAEVADLLRLHSGIEIARDGGPGQRTSIFMRGTESNHTLVMLDGVKINPGTTGGAAIQNIDTALIERIEVVRGPRSTLYGSEAIGGVINIITRGAPDQKGTRYQAGLHGGSNGTHGASFGAHHRADPNRAAGLSLAYDASDGIPTRVGSNTDRGYDLGSLHAWASQRIGATEVRVSHWQATGTTEYLLDVFDPVTYALTGFEPINQDFTNRVSEVKLESLLGESWVSTLRVNRTVDDLDQNQSPDFARTTRDALDWQNDVQLGERQLLTVGAYLAQEDTRALSYGSAFDEKTDIRAAYLQDDLHLGRHRLLVGARHTDHEGFGSHTDWNLEYGYDLNERMRLLAAAATGFRAPDATDRFGYGGNPNLNPETSRNLELGLRYRPGRTQNVQLSAYENEIDDLIDWDPVAGMQNVDRARIRGVEALYTYAGESLRIEAALGWQDPRNLTENTQLWRRAKETARLSIDLNLGSYRLGADAVYAGKRFDFGDVPLDAYTLLNLRASTELGRGLTLAARVENATDEDYELAAGYNTLGRSYYAELRYAFGD